MNRSLTSSASSTHFGLLSAVTGWRVWLFRTWVARLPVGQLTVTFPSGRRETFNGAGPGVNAHLNIHDMRVVNRLISAGDLGLAESYMAGEWSTPDLSAIMRLGLVNEQALGATLQKTTLHRLFDRLRHARHSNTRRGSRRNIAAHYDLGNDFYGHWLDPSMTYSSALFENLDEPLAPAQRRKYLRLAAQLELKPGDRVLEIGCGWGGFAEIVARDFGCKVVALTLSREQAAYARDRLARAGLSDRVEVRLQDYRDVQGEFDKIASIEMFEAVGEQYWSVYLDTLRERLAPRGKAALQIITMDDAYFNNYRRNPEFIQRYIFPGGMLPGPSVFQQAAVAASLEITDQFTFGPSYGETLRRWDMAFQNAWTEIKPLGFDDRFYRMWRYYLCYCEVGFDTGRINVTHFTLKRA